MNSWQVVPGFAGASLLAHRFGARGHWLQPIAGQGWLQRSPGVTWLYRNPRVQ